MNSYPEMPGNYGASLTEEASPSTDESPPPVETLSPGKSDVIKHESVNSLQLKRFSLTRHIHRLQMHREYSQW